MAQWYLYSLIYIILTDIEIIIIIYYHWLYGKYRLGINNKKIA